ncbi:tubulin binding cofactor A [Ascodesmis nigricans]|uniref:Tubulin-specific chaperone A n=1 Tax=Ascodesmis nigricans TaxID=341454 RepID=A0A4V3SJV7_9PEZI|nr:tubulin binding cofactor A [Ascodesmis nigricans]
MAPPTGLNIKTSSVIRLVKEEKSYHNELVLQTSLLTRLESGEEIEGYDIKQQKTVVEQTKEVIPQVRQKLKVAVEQLEYAIDAAPESESAESIEKAKSAVAEGKQVLKTAL